MFWADTPFLLIKGIWFSADTQACTCVPSITLMQFYIKNNTHQALVSTIFEKKNYQLEKSLMITKYISDPNMKIIMLLF
jgi:hypothetical protein